jgi:hypothetical protein
MAKVRNSWLKAFQDLGFSPRFVGGESLPKLAAGQPGVLVLPTARALSAAERDAVAGCAARGFRIFADGTPGLFDEHGRLVPRNSLESLFPLANSETRSFAVRKAAGESAVAKDGDIAAYAKDRLAAEPTLAWAEWIARELPPFPREVLLPLPARTRVHRYKLGDARLLAFERNIDYQMSEDLKQAGGNEPLEKPIQLEARLAKPAHVYDLRAGKYLGQTDRIAFQLDPWQPSFFALLPEKIAEDRLLDRLQARAGKN